MNWIVIRAKQGGIRELVVCLWLTLNSERRCSVTTNSFEEGAERVLSARRAHLSRTSFLVLDHVCRGSSGRQVVAMMQAAESWHGYPKRDDPLMNTTIPFHFADTGPSNIVHLNHIHLSWIALR